MDRHGAKACSTIGVWIMYVATVSQGVENSTTITRLSGPLVSEQRMVLDHNKNVFMDQYGNSVLLRVPVGQQPVNLDVILVDNPVNQPVTLTIASLHLNPFVQKLVDESANTGDKN